MQGLRFEGSGMEYFKIWIVNVLLSIVTLGLYYPWAKVRNHRYFYANSTLDKRNFEYHATGKQLFIGYLIGMALFIAYAIIQEVSPTGGLIVTVIFILALPWIIWRSLKFNMRITSYSNVRFGFVGKLSGSYLNFFVFPITLMVVIYGGIATGIMMILGFAGGNSLIGIIILLLAIALGLIAGSYIKKRNTSYILNGSRYGQGEFITKVETKQFVKIMLKVIGLSLLMFIIIYAVIGALLYLIIGMEGLKGMIEMKDNPAAIEAALGGQKGLIIGVGYLFFIIASMLIMAYSLTRQRAYVYANTTLDEKISFKSTLSARSLAYIMVTNFLAIIFTLGLAFPWAKVRLARLMLENTHVSANKGFDAFITQKEKESSSLGDQIGDAFDVDVGLGF